MAELLPGAAPIVAAGDYVRAYPGLFAARVAAPFAALGTDEFGRSDTRRVPRTFFEFDRRLIVVAALAARASRIPAIRGRVAEAIGHYGIDADAAAPWTR